MWILHVTALLLLMLSRRAEADVTVALPPAEYYRLTGELSIAQILHYAAAERVDG